MKQLFIIALIASAGICSQIMAQNVTGKVKTDSLPIERIGPFVENDTVFLYRYSHYEYGSSNYKDFYIDTNRQSKSYQWILTHAASINNNLSEWNMDDFKASLRRIKEIHPTPLTKHPISGQISEGWLPLHSYQGKCYISELDTYSIFWLTDSLHYSNNLDGPYPSIIQSFEKVSPRHYQLSRFYGYSTSNINIYIIDEKRKIAVFIESSPGEEHIYKGLFVARETAHLFDIIACRSRDKTPNMVKYDKIDFDALLKPFKDKNAK